MKSLLGFCFLFLFSCARVPLTDQSHAMRLASTAPKLSDSLGIESLREAFRKNREALVNSKLADLLHFGPITITRTAYLQALDSLTSALDSWEHFQSELSKNFDFYEVYGADKWSDVFATGYYVPHLMARKKCEAGFTEPLYRLPLDVVKVDYSAFAAKNPALQFPHAPTTLIGRLTEEHKVIPYFDRAEIDGKTHPLAEKNLEIAWVSPIDAFYLQIQGSGELDFPDGKKVRVGYAGQNGAPYSAIGKYLRDVIPLEQMSMQRIRAYLSTLPEDQLYIVLAQNPSFVFFQELKGDALTYSGAEVTAGRTIATDQSFFPKATLAFLDIELPVFADAAAPEPSAWVSSPRFVFDQDTGGAIRGGGRIDLFMGEDANAAAVAGVLKRHASLYYLLPKSYP